MCFLGSDGRNGDLPSLPEKGNVWQIYYKLRDAGYHHKRDFDKSAERDTFTIDSKGTIPPGNGGNGGDGGCGGKRGEVTIIALKQTPNISISSQNGLNFIYKQTKYGCLH